MGVHKWAIVRRNNATQQKANDQEKADTVSPLVSLVSPFVSLCHCLCTQADAEQQPQEKAGLVQ